MSPGYTAARSGGWRDLAMRWLVDLLGFPKSFVGTFTSGGSTANLVGLGAARQAAGERLGLRPSIDGIAGLPEPRVYASTKTHHVVGRALGVLGMGRANLRSIPVDGDGRIDLDLLQRALDEDAAAGRTAVAIVGCAGDVNTGVVDPLPELARIARERETWLQVDGAYGGFGLLDPRVRDLYGDVASYDSFAVDPHKWLAAPVGTGATIVRDEEILGRAFTIESGACTGYTESPFGRLVDEGLAVGLDLAKSLLGGVLAAMAIATVMWPNRGTPRGALRLGASHRRRHVGGAAAGDLRSRAPHV